jgi:hypothetical protein
MNLLYETVMSFPIEGLRKDFFEKQKKIASDFSVADYLEMGYSVEDIIAVKGLQGLHGTDGN